MADRLPEPDVAREWLETMTLIRRFEERAGEMYARAKVGGFLHLSIGEEATIVGSARALRTEDYLISTYRSHGHALVRGFHGPSLVLQRSARDGADELDQEFLEVGDCRGVERIPAAAGEIDLGVAGRQRDEVVDDRLHRRLAPEAGPQGNGRGWVRGLLLAGDRQRE